MNTARIAMLATLAGLAMPVQASNSAYDLLIVACDNIGCKRITDQTIPVGLANLTEYNRNGLRMLIETLARRGNEEDARVSLDVRPNAAAGVTPTAGRVQILVEPCTLRTGAFSSVASFISEGKVHHVWARLTAR